MGKIIPAVLSNVLKTDKLTINGETYYVKNVIFASDDDILKCKVVLEQKPELKDIKINIEIFE